MTEPLYRESGNRKLPSEDVILQTPAMRIVLPGIEGTTDVGILQVKNIGVLSASVSGPSELFALISTPKLVTPPPVLPPPALPPPVPEDPLLTSVTVVDWCSVPDAVKQEIQYVVVLVGYTVAVPERVFLGTKKSMLEQELTPEALQEIVTAWPGVETILGLALMFMDEGPPLWLEDDEDLVVGVSGVPTQVFSFIFARVMGPTNPVLLI